MKQSSTTLFEIISRMTDDEKKYFRGYSSILKQFKHLSTTRLLELFEAISSAKAYDETKLKRRFAATLSEKSFKTCKTVLRELVLESLYAHSNSGNAADTPSRQLSHAEILIAKDLNHQALAHLHHLQHNMAASAQPPNPLLEMDLLTLKNKALQHIPGTSAAAKTAAQFARYKQALILQHDQEQQLITLHLAQLVSQHLLLNTEYATSQLNEMQKITDFYARRINNPNHYYVVQQSAYIALLEGKFIKYLDHCHHLFSHFHQLADKEQLNAETEHHYAETFINLIRACLLAKDTEMLMLTFNIAWHPYTKLFADQPYYYSFLHYAFLLMFQLDGVQNHNAGQAHHFETNYCPATDENDMLRYRWFYTTLALYYHSAGDYKLALRQCRKVTATNPNNFTEIHCRDFCTLFQFIIQHDMLPANCKTDLCADTLLEAAVNKLKREHGLTGEKKNRSVELCILSYLSNPSEEARKLCLAELNLLQDLPAATHFKTLFNFEQWLGHYTQLQNAVA